MDEMILTFQTRLLLDHKKEEVLQECAYLLNTVERSLHAEVAKGKSSASCKNDFLKAFGITARQFNACRVSLEGKLSACKAGQERSLSSLKQQIDALDMQIQTLARKPSKRFSLHQKKRRRHTLTSRLAAMDKKQQRIRLCFGGKKLFSAQYHLEKNGFASHAEWRKNWNAKRNSEFFVLGSKDETAGNQTCTARLQDKLVLRLRLPPALEKLHGKYLEIEDVEFAYGQKAILDALKNKQALSYRFKRDAKSWKVFVSTAIKKPETISKEEQGVIGLDLNVDHIAYIETDRFGNFIKKEIFSWISYGKTKERLKALTADICKTIVDKAKEVKKPIIIEKLDFQKKKLSLQEGSKKLARLLSSFAYGQFFLNLRVRAFKNGIEVHTVNPAFTSVIGCVNYAKRYGLSCHLAAALCIARRYQKFSESPSSSEGNIPNRKGIHVAFVLPVRNRTKHVWHFWGRVKKKISTVLAAHNRAIDPRVRLKSDSCDRKLPFVIGENPIRESLAKLLG